MQMWLVGAAHFASSAKGLAGFAKGCYVYRLHACGLQVGQRVFAIGFPFALDQSLTAGIVSGLGREMQSITGEGLQLWAGDRGVQAMLEPTRRSQPGCRCTLDALVHMRRRCCAALLQDALELAGLC